MTTKETEIKILRKALYAILEAYIDLYNDGYFGEWNPEDEEVVKSARQALNYGKKGNQGPPFSIYAKGKN